MLVLYSFEFLSYPFKHFNSYFILPHTGIVALLYKQGNSVLLLPHIEILDLFLFTLEFWPYPYDIATLILSFQTVEFWRYL